MRHRRLIASVLAGAALAALVAPAADAAWRQAEPPTVSAPIKALMDQGDQYYRAGRFEEASRFYRQAADQARALKDLVGEGAALNNIGAAFSAQGDRAKAVEAYEKSLQLKQASKDLSGTSQTLNNLGNIYAQTGDAGKAVEYYGRSLKIKEQMGDGGGQATTLLNIATVYKQTGDQAKALETFEKARGIFRARKDVSGEGMVLNNIGNLYAETGDPTSALKYYEESLKLKRQAKDVPGQAKTLANLGAIYATSQPSEAIKRYGEALELMKQSGDQHGAAAVYNNLGGFYAATGQPEQAAAQFKQAAAAFRAAGDPSGEGIAYQGLGALALRQGDLKEAQQFFERALPPLRAVGDRRAIAATLQGMGAVEAESGQFQTALQNYLEAARYARAAGDVPGMAGILGGTGAVYAASGDARKAVAAYQEAYDLRVACGDRNGAARMLTAAGFVYEGAGQYGEAQKTYEAAIRQSEQVRQDLSRLSVETRSAFLAANLDAYQGLVRAHLKQNHPEEAFAAAQQAKARLLNDLMNGGRAELRGSLSEADFKQERALRARADALNTAMIGEGVRNEVGSKKRFAEYKAELQGVERDLSAFLDAAYARNPDLAVKRGAKSATLAEVAAALPEDTALLEFVIVAPSRAIRGKAGTADGDTTLLVVTKSAGKAVCTAYPLKINADRLAGQAEAFRKACADPKADWKDEAKALYETLIAPAAGELTGKKRLVVCPDGPLWDVPFGALVTDAGISLLQQYEIAFAFSATGVASALGSRSKPKAAREAFVLANPDFGGVDRFGPGRPIGAADRIIGAADRPIGSPDRPIGAPDRIIGAADRIIGAADRAIVVPDAVVPSPESIIGAADRLIGAPDRDISGPSRLIGAADRESPILNGGKLAPLPGTMREADALKKSFAGAKIVTGKEAQEAVVKAEAGKSRFLHLATHGFFNDGSPLSSCIVLAQANAKDIDNDGYLTAREIFGLDLSAVEMTVLSACNTGRGEKKRGEGVVGLTWALFAAGCPTQVLSQWAVNDTSTAMLMERFYKRLATGEAKGDALRNAALSLSQEPDTVHPYYWAPFALYGDWR